jgi:hypothetical protein
MTRLIRFSSLKSVRPHPCDTEEVPGGISSHPLSPLFWTFSGFVLLIGTCYRNFKFRQITILKNKKFILGFLGFILSVAFSQAMINEFTPKIH